MKIHPTAVIAETAKIGENVEIGPYAIVEDGVIIGDGSKIEPHARLCRGARIGKNCRICSFTTISGDPQDLVFDTSVESYAEIEDGTVIRENSTIHRASFAGKATVVGKNCFLMSGAHIGHDCVLSDNIIMANYAAAAGHVHIDSNVFVSGGVMLHQFVRVGEGAMLSGNSAVSKDVPPFVNTFDRNNMAGINVIGMTRRKFSRGEISEVKALYAKVYATPSARKNALELIQNGEAKTEAGARFLKFFELEGRHYLIPKDCEQ